MQDTEEIQVQVELRPGPILKVGKARPNLKPLSVETLAFCEHTKKIVVEYVPDFPIFQFSCDKCGKGFTHKSHLVYHKTAHGDDIQGCSKCDLSFETKSSLTYICAIWTHTLLKGPTQL